MGVGVVAEILSTTAGGGDFDSVMAMQLLTGNDETRGAPGDLWVFNCDIGMGEGCADGGA